MSRSEKLKDQGRKLAEQYGVDKLYATTDGQFFLQESYAKLHAKNKNLKVVLLNYSSVVDGDDADADAGKDGVKAAPAASGGSSDDLTLVKGVGPSTAKKLQAAGISSFADLAQADAAALAEATGVKEAVIAEAIAEAGNHI